MAPELDRRSLVLARAYGPDATPNMVIQGNNMEVLRFIKDDHSGTVRCIYLDPPYNNAERYNHYSDESEHDEWLAFMEQRLALLMPFLRDDGSIWISIDENEMHYLKVLADRIFGRKRFIHTIVWEHRRSRENRRAFSNNHEYILVYAKDPEIFRKRRNRVPAATRLLPRYRNPDNDPRGPWQSVSANVQAGHATASQFYEIVAPSGMRHRPPKGRCWSIPESRMKELIAADAVWFGRDGRGVPRVKRYLSDVDLSVCPDTLWTADSVGTTSDAKRQVLRLVPQAPVFDTPKPEDLMRRILEIATDPGDVVLDPFLGSGTTAAVSHKMGRSYIGIEIGDHAATHCVHRLEQVIAGENGGISPDVGWQGGGGFSFLRVPSEIESAA